MPTTCTLSPAAALRKWHALVAARAVVVPKPNMPRDDVRRHRNDAAVRVALSNRLSADGKARQAYLDDAQERCRDIREGLHCAV